jgi:glycosyltransferase involved in cell wall biosynthesis
MAGSGRIGICAIFKNEAPFLREWIAYHRVIGVDHFILFDNGSVDGGKETILSSHLSDFVTIIDWPERPGQITAYQHCIETYMDGFDWVAFIDVDEFIHPLRDSNLPELLQRAGNHAAMLIQWMNFGPGGHRDRPPGLVIEEYNLRFGMTAGVNRHVKSIIRRGGVNRAGGCHVAQLRGEPCDADGKTIPNRAIQPDICCETAVLNHYYTKSHEDWLIKVKRGRATMRDDPEVQRKLEWFERYEKGATIEDTRIARFLPAVKVTLAGEFAEAKSFDIGPGT